MFQLFLGYLIIEDSDVHCQPVTTVVRKVVVVVSNDWEFKNYDDHCYENVTENFLFMLFQTLSLLFSLTQYLKCPTDDQFFRNVSNIKTGNGKLLSSVLTSSTQHRLWKFDVLIVQWTFRTKNFDTPAELLCFP